MALPLSQIHFCPSKFTTSKSNPPKTTFHLTQKPTTPFSKTPQKVTQFPFKPHKLLTILKASQQEENNNTTTANESTTNPPGENTQSDELKDLGAEIKKAMMENEKKETGFLSGVGEEIKEIEWPAFNKVLATTGVVVGVIAGSSVVLLTVNAVLAELSDRVFAGRGVQDFFG